MRLLPFLVLSLLGACGGATTTTKPLDNRSFEPGLIAVAPHLEGALLRAFHASAAIRNPGVRAGLPNIAFSAPEQVRAIAALR